MSANTRGVDLIPHTATTRTALSWEEQKEVVGSYLLNRPIFMVPRANQFSHRLKTCVQHFGTNIKDLHRTQSLSEKLLVIRYSGIKIHQTQFSYRHYKT